MIARVYRVELVPRAAKQLAALPRAAQRRIASRIDALAVDPRPAGAKISRDEELYRIRVGDCRILYEIRDRILLVLVVGVGHRREVYCR